MTSIQDRIAKTKEAAATTPAFKGDPAEVVRPRPAVAEGQVIRAGAGGDRVVDTRRAEVKTPRPRPHRITVDLSKEEYADLKAMRTADVGIAGVVRGALAVVKEHPELVAEVQRLGAR